MKKAFNNNEGKRSGDETPADSERGRDGIIVDSDLYDLLVAVANAETDEEAILYLVKDGATPEELEAFLESSGFDEMAGAEEKREFMTLFRKVYNDYIAQQQQDKKTGSQNNRSSGKGLRP